MFAGVLDISFCGGGDMLRKCDAIFMRILSFKFNLTILELIVRMNLCETNLIIGGTNLKTEKVI